MSGWEFVSKLLDKLVSWQVVVVGLVFFFRKSMAPVAVNLLERLAFLKWGSVELGFAERSVKLIKSESESDPKNKLSENEKSELQRSQVVYSTPYYKLYANGILVEHVTNFKILPHTSSRHIIYPVSFPNELINIQVIGDIDAKVLNSSLSNCTISFSPSPHEREIQIIISGI
jgi:hypothetical protein